jgi:ferredoxin
LTGGWYQKLPPPGSEEVAVLDAATAGQSNSRLACQIRCVAENDGITLTVAPE